MKQTVFIQQLRHLTGEILLKREGLCQAPAMFGGDATGGGNDASAAMRVAMDHFGVTGNLLRRTPAAALEKGGGNYAGINVDGSVSIKNQTAKNQIDEQTGTDKFSDLSVSSKIFGKYFHIFASEIIKLN
ncbi:MAG: hypothetical protein LBS79_01735 [Tannerella sp.]|nr:hypothetical protein [Tannerella sp.]